MVMEDTMKDAIRQELHRIHIAAHNGDLATVDEAVQAISGWIEKTPMRVLPKEPEKAEHKAKKKKSA